MDQEDLSLLAIVITLDNLFGVEMSEIIDKNALGDEGLSGHKLQSVLCYSKRVWKVKNKSI